MKTRELTMEEKHDIVKLKKEGKTIRAISEALGIANTTVWNILHKHATTGLLTTKHRTGRPRKTSAGDDRTIVRAVKKNPQVTVGSITNTLLLAGVNVSQSTVRRRLREQKYHFRYISYVPLLAGPEPNDSETRDDKLKEEQLESREADGLRVRHLVRLDSRQARKRRVMQGIGGRIAARERVAL